MLPTGPGRIKNNMTYEFTIAVLIHYLWRSPVNFPLENKVFQRPCRSDLPPSYFCSTSVVNYPKDPGIVKALFQVNLLHVVNLLGIVIHYPRAGPPSVVIQYPPA